MKLLILCDMFPPAFAPRMGYLCKYLVRAGWQPVVVTEQINDRNFSFLEGYAEATYINYYKANGKLARRLEWIIVQLLDLLFSYKDRKMVKVASKILQQGDFQAILCASYRTFPLPAARKLAEKFDLPFVADTRDIIEQYVSTKYISHSFKTFAWLDKLIVKAFRRKLLTGRNRALQKADCVTTVSPWHVSMMQQYNPRVELIYNGYDPELFYPEHIVTPQFCLTFTGRLVSLETRDPHPLFEAIARLSEEKQISPTDFRIQWYTDDASWEMLSPLLREYNIEEYMDYFGYVPGDRIPAILNRSSILLQLANKAGGEGPKGIISTKLFESFAVEKPMLCVRSDESYLEEMIRLARAGASARTAQEAYDFILHYYHEWKTKGYTSVDVDKEVVESFSRKRQADQFMHIFAELMNRKVRHHG
ncbi:glycosyltransferase involved in cell wall biosynthesis [Parabacteroides sp. PF5-5]|uniref:glycosyltransferase n=1 Tax=unclassified Parabacteroides TaxID=2649774 RepID=UPI0024770B7D|nr:MULTISPECIES: glycosyltransferase [unclassified Parabacteroides]MDH6306223.1 glycosyltransferase involved in cell wall biosynthesis [Parabacteroides sp. PH5-39]MDH6317182.1 glycosyltransferase involved in cell wall biosynthesis [Parabacteroides sp. PF5-13]MDH6320935.1 glycosyltransferase involved in cell wall biosynthesis [Parabacteroides sp. PH5-13]MDH6324666.1 glycosyltransferase involved in cell wall biosynthesis [Parabacteroides sp. PH5-8]MDH6328283.1 glycosyltransferase involved in cel